MDMKIDVKELKRELTQLVRERSYEQRRVVLASGRESDFYFDGKQTTLHPRGAYLVGTLLFEQLKLGPAVQAVGGPTLGADPMVASLALVSSLRDEPIPAFIVRKEPKGHGTMSWIEGGKNIPDGAQVAVVEDVVTTGGSTLKAIGHIEDAGFKVLRVICLVDRQEGGAENLAQHGYKLEPLLTREEVAR